MSTWAVLLVGLASLVVSALGGWPVTAGVLRWAARTDAGDVERARRTGDATTGPARAAGGPGDDEDSDGSDDAAVPEDDRNPVGAHARAVLRGGMWIGLLERLAVTGCLVTGYPGGVAFVIAVKGLGRYPELRENPEVSERFVIGTLTSMLWAGAVGLAARAVLLA